LKKFYVRINGVTFSVEGHKLRPKEWSLACEHSAFQGVCMKCAFGILNGFPKDSDDIVILDEEVSLSGRNPKVLGEKLT